MSEFQFEFPLEVATLMFQIVVKKCDRHSGTCTVSFLPHLPPSTLRVEDGWGVFKGEDKVLL